MPLPFDEWRFFFFFDKSIYFIFSVWFQVSLYQYHMVLFRLVRYEQQLLQPIYLFHLQCEYWIFYTDFIRIWSHKSEDDARQRFKNLTKWRCRYENIWVRYNSQRNMVTKFLCKIFFTCQTVFPSLLSTFRKRMVVSLSSNGLSCHESIK
jgi:hypothetical protein